MFRTNGYVQDERYITREHMDVRRDYVQDERYAAGAGSAGAACIKFALSLSICMGAEVAQYLTSGHALKHPCALILDFLSRKVQK